MTRAAFIDFSYARSLRGHEKRAPRHWAPQTMAVLTADVLSDRDTTMAVPRREAEVHFPPRGSNSDGQQVRDLITGFLPSVDLVVSHGLLKSDLQALQMVDARSAKYLASRAVDTMELIALRVADALPHKRIPYGGLSLVHLTSHMDIDVPAKVQGEHPINDCYRLMTLWNDLLNSTEMLYSHRGEWSQSHDAAVIDVDDDLKADLMRDEARNPLPLHPLADPFDGSTVPDSVLEIAEESLSTYALQQSMQFLSPAANDRVRSRIMEGKRVLSQDRVPLGNAIKLASHPELLWIRGNRRLAQSSATLQLRIATIIRDHRAEGGSDGELARKLTEYCVPLGTYPLPDVIQERPSIM